MKRFFAALLAALMVFSLVTIPAVAEGEVVFEVPTVNAQPGDTVSIPVTLTGSNFECHAMNMNVQYDAEALTLNSATEGDAISGATMKVLDTESELGKVKLGLLYAYDGMTAGGTLFTMNFTVNENATGNAALTINVVTFANMPAGSTTATPIAYIANNGAVVVGQPATPVPETDTPAPATPIPETPIPETPAPGEEMTLDEALNVQGGTLHFENDADYPFVVENDYVKSSNQGQRNTQPGVTTTVNLTASKLLSFNYKVSSEANWDYVFVSIDGTIVAPTDADSKYILSGDRAAEWLNYTYIVPEGEHTVTIGYRKDSSGDRLDDTAWLDEIQFTDIVNVTGVEFSQDALTMPLARTAQLEWTVLPADAANKNVTFASDNTEVATVNASGLVTGVAPGTANITVTTVDGGFTDVIAVTVEEAVAVTEIVIAPAAITIPVTTSVTETLVANVIPENATDTTVAWTSEDETIATVSVNGQIKGIAPGTVTINATSANGVTGTCEVTVVAPEDFPGLDSINFTNMNPLPYDNLEVGIGPGYGGTPVLIRRGNTNTLTYTYATGFSINVEAGQKIYFNTYWYGGTPGDSNDPNRKDTFMTLYDSEFNYLDHNDDGASFGISPYSGIEYVFETAGTYYVVVTPYNHASNNGNGKGLVEMHAAEVLPTEIETIELADFSMFTGTNTNIIDRAVFTPEEYEISDFVFTSSNEAVASIDADGKVFALAEGTTTITITDNVSNATASAVLTVNEISEDDYAMIVLNVNAGETGVFQDGSGYQMLLDADATAYGNEIPAQGPLTQSGNAPAGLYDIFEYKIPENADGILTTSNIVVSGMDYVLVPAGTYDWCITNPTPGDRIWIASDSGSIGGRANDYTFEAGNTYTLTVSLDGQYDRTDITVTPGIEEPTPTATPAITPTPTPAPTPDPGATGWGFETDPFAEGWTIRDDDGDGYNWEWMDASGSNYNVYEGTHCMASASFQNSPFGGGTALNPDNWLISPEFVAGNTVTFWYVGQDPDYAAETFGVYVIANGTTSAELGHFTASNTYQQGSVDISAYAGQTVQVAFRHYGITDMFRLNLDLVEVSGGGSTPNTPVPPTTIPEPTLVPLDVTFSAAAPASVAAGEEFQVAVNIGGVIDYEAHVLNLRLDYDTDAFEYLHDEPGAVMNQMIENSGTAILDGFSIPGSIRFGAMMPNAGFTAYGTLFTLTFRAKADAANGEHNFDLNVVEFNNFPMGGTSTPIEHTDVDAIVEVTGGSTVTPTPTEVPTPTPGPGSDLDEAMNVAGGTLHFTTDGDYPWIVEETWGKSTNINVASSTSTVSTTVTAAAGDILQFDFRSFGEGFGDTVWDGLHLFIDGTEVAKWNRVETWTTYAVELTAGEHTITWTYQKDSTVDKEGDYANVDNVYVGAPVVPTSIEVENVTVPAGRRATVAYTVLPAEAFNKNVTFSIANTAIATVNENGVVVGVAEGTTTVTVTSVADPTVSGSATVTVTEALPTVNLEGYIAFDPEGTSGIWGGFADYDPSVIENFGTMGSTFGGAFAGGNVYGFMYNSDTNDTRFYIMNADTHQVAYPGTSAGRVVVAMAYNHAEGEMYAIAANDADGRSIYTVNLATGTLTEVAVLNAGADTIMTLAIDGSGNAYGLSYEANNAVLYSINLTNGNCTAIGGTGHGLEYVQATVWDHNTNQLFWAQYSKVETDKGQLFVIDPATGAATLCGTIGTGAEVTVLYTKNNMPVAPIEVPEYNVTFVDGLTNEPIPGGYTVEAGTILDEADFPTPPEHEGYVFTGWDYNGAPVYSDLTIKARYRDPSATTATISLTVGDVWGDGSGYQMLLDADATAFGNEIPAEGPLTMGGDAPAGLYDAFEYKIPVNADGSTTTSNIVINNTITIEVPAGTYDWCIANPTPGDRIWIASAQGNIGGRADDYEFEAGYTYNFTVYLLGQNDATDVEIIPGGETPSPEPPITDEPITDEPITDEPITDEPITDEPITDEPITDEPITDEPITDEPITDEPITDEPGVTDEPTAVPTDAPNPPITGAMSLIGVGIAAIVASAGVVIFRKKEED